MSEALRPVPLARRAGPLARVAEGAVLRLLEGIEGGSLRLRLPDGAEHVFGSGPPVAVAVESYDLFKRLVWNARIGFGESYAAGEWRADDLVALFELLIRNVEAAKARRPLSTLARLERFRPRLPSRNGLRRARENIHYHYDLGNELYRLMLDDSMTYSCAYWERPEETLEQAQQNKLRRICDKLQLGPDDRVLEIGCGFGSFAIHAARERGCHVTGLTISQRQYELARERVAEAGLADRVEILNRDYRLLEGQFTRIASIEMLEAIGYRQCPTFFAACDRLLAPGGLAAIQTIAIPDERFDAYRRRDDWIRRYIFPGSLLPSLTAITRALVRSSRLQVYGLEDIGIHYARTLRTWRERFFARIEDVRRLGYDERFVRIWGFYLSYCEAAFRTRSLRDLQLVLTRPFNDGLPAYPSARVTF